MTLHEINSLIKALEESSCTFSNCQKLAALYICRDNFRPKHKQTQNKDADDVIKDLMII